MVLQLHTAIVDDLKQLVKVRVGRYQGQYQLNPITDERTQFDKINPVGVIRSMGEVTLHDLHRITQRSGLLLIRCSSAIK
ncbi:hypothetical protein ARC96_02300 [Escherichia coli]|nr:hypothetical protein ARC81_02140 [Escherichia coli]KUG78581.1 hypothetical protein ARC96_02300 [Escherichia coli]